MEHITLQFGASTVHYSQVKFFPIYITVTELMSAASSTGLAKKSPGLSNILIGLGVENTLLYDS